MDNKKKNGYAGDRRMVPGDKKIIMRILVIAFFYTLVLMA
jgi:hypothetical protein